MTTTDPTPALSAHIRDAWRSSDGRRVKGSLACLAVDTMIDLANIAAEVATKHLDAQETAPLAVDDHVRIVRPVASDGVRESGIAVGDVGTVTIDPDLDGDIIFQRDGTRSTVFIAAENVERVEDDETDTTLVPTEALDNLRTAVHHAHDLHLAEAAREFDAILTEGGQS